MRPDTPFLTALDEGLQGLRVPEGDGHRENAGTVGDEFHIDPQVFAINVLFKVPEELPGWLIDLEQQIEQLAWLEQNFDGEGSPAIRSENMVVAKDLVRRFYTDRKLRCTDVFPTAQAGVELELETQFWEATIWVNDPTSVEYFVKCGNKKHSGEAPPHVIPDKIWESVA